MIYIPNTEERLQWAKGLMNDAKWESIAFRIFIPLLILLVWIVMPGNLAIGITAVGIGIAVFRSKSITEKIYWAGQMYHLACKPNLALNELKENLFQPHAIGVDLDTNDESELIVRFYRWEGVEKDGIVDYCKVYSDGLSIINLLAEMPEEEFFQNLPKPLREKLEKVPEYRYLLKIDSVWKY